MEDIDEPGWYVGCVLGEDTEKSSWGGILPQEGSSLKGTLEPFGSQEPLAVTVAEDGTDGLALAVDGGETYHFTKTDMPETAISITINAEGWGSIAYAEGEQTRKLMRNIRIRMRPSIWTNRKHIHSLHGPLQEMCS